ncbi:hypothetical protein JJE68_01620 [Pediococcus acidilactici]|nr:hypothetical protein JJE68_01620 [Pediococcus acidilactici]
MPANYPALVSHSINRTASTIPLTLISPIDH